MEAAAIRELCKPLRLPTVATQAVRLAEQAGQERQSHLRFLEALLSAEVEEREQNAAVAFRHAERRRHSVRDYFAAQYPACMYPCQRFDGSLSACHA